MKKLSVHLLLLCLMALLLIPFAGCKKEDGVDEETPATTDTALETTPAEPMGTTDTGTTDMGTTDTGTTEPMTTDATTPPAGQ